MEKTYDYIIIGSGFGGSVSAMRLAEKGYLVLVLEKGKRFEAKDFPKSDWQLRKFLWAPVVRFFGILKLTLFRQLFVLSGTGVGGGSLVYANTHVTPDDCFFSHPSWKRFGPWKERLQPFYKIARFMLGSTLPKTSNLDDQLLRKIATDMGVSDTFRPVEVGLFYGDPDKAIDPYFKGKGPLRNGCRECGACMLGCRYNAKNTLDKNYLYFAEKYSAKILAETEVDRIDFAPDDNLYTLTCKKSTSIFGKKITIHGKNLIVSAGVLGTLKLLLKQKYKYKSLPRLSDRLGELVRTNSESLGGIMLSKKKLNHGIAISSMFKPSPDTTIEGVKMPDGSGALFKLGTLAASGSNPWQRRFNWIFTVMTRPIAFLRTVFKIRAADKGYILLVMQTIDNAFQIKWKQRFFGSGLSIDTERSDYERVPAFIPEGQETIERLAKEVEGIPINATTEVLGNITTTAHILGGCPMGENRENGVIGPDFTVHGYPGMRILDGSVIQANPGVNPSLTITTISEYAMSLIPDKSESQFPTQSNGKRK